MAKLEFTLSEDDIRSHDDKYINDAIEYFRNSIDSGVIIISASAVVNELMSGDNLDRIIDECGSNNAATVIDYILSEGFNNNTIVYGSFLGMYELLKANFLQEIPASE